MAMPSNGEEQNWRTKFWMMMNGDDTNQMDRSKIGEPNFCYDDDEWR